MDDEDGKGAAAAAAAAARPAESTGAYSLDVNVDAGADVEAEASTRHDGRTGTRTTAAAEPSSSTSTSTSSSANATTVAAGEAELDGDNDAGTKMDHNLHNPLLHSHDYGHGGASRRPLPMSLPARSSNSFTPINDFVRQDDHYATLPPLGPSALPTMNAMNCPQPQPLPPRQRTSLPTARPSSSATTNAPAAYYPGHTDGRLLPTNYGIQPGEMAQYALLPPEPKQFQRQLAKKEIKRRTKTGCMTCRKRRIKCDEARPSCNNCKKSKRECLGYDPVFREQSIPGHTNTRSSPAPSSPSSRDPTTPNYHHEPSQETRHETPAAPEATARGLPTAAPFIPADAPPGTHEWWRTVIANLHYPFVPAADDNRDPVQGHSTRIKSEPTEPSRSGTFFDPITGAASESREACARNDSQSNGLPSQNSGGKPFRVPGVMRVADLINGFGTNAPAPEPVQTDEAHQEVTKVYHEIYANGLSAFFESTWFFFTDDGKMTFPRTGNTAGHVAAFLKLMNGVEVYHHAFMAHCSGVELRLVWELSKLASTAAPDKADNRMRVTLPPEDDAIEVKNRFSVVDALLGGDFLPWNPLTPSVEDGNPHRVREFDFWYQLGDYLRWNADQDPAGEETRRQEAIDRMRWLLDGRENRDVLYSIVLLRHYATRFDLGEVVKAKYHLPEAEAQNRVVVASKFITHQAEVAGGTTNVIRRISDIAKRRYVEPANITQGDQQPQQ